MLVDTRDLLELFRGDAALNLELAGAGLRTRRCSIVLTDTIRAELMPADANVEVWMWRMAEIRRKLPVVDAVCSDLHMEERQYALVMFASDPSASAGTSGNDWPGRKKDVQRFEIDVRNAWSERELSVQAAQPFARWLRQHPRVAPGWRLVRECKRINDRDIGRRRHESDGGDLANIGLLPHVAGATADRHAIELIRKGCRRLRLFDDRIDYEEKVAPNLPELLEGMISFD